MDEIRVRILAMLVAPFFPVIAIVLVRFVARKYRDVTRGGIS